MPETTEGASFVEVMQRYLDEGIVFHSAVRGAKYCVESVDDQGAVISRLDADESVRVTGQNYVQKAEDLRESGGGCPFAELNHTATIRATLVQVAPLMLSADRKTAIYAADSEVVKDQFLKHLELLRVDSSRGKAQIYKPAMLACMIEGIANRELTENRISFDWITEKFCQRLGLKNDADGQKKAAMPFYHLSGEHFWMLCYQDVNQRLESGGDGPAAIKRKVRHATINDVYWNVLQNEEFRNACLKRLAKKWWPEMMNIPELLQKFISQAQEGSLHTKGYVKEYADVQVKVGFGKGNQARIPWLAFLAKGHEVQTGIYPVYLYFKEKNKLVWCFGVSETNRPPMNWPSEIGSKYPVVKNVIEKPKRYGTSYVYNTYPIADGKIRDVSEEVLQSDFEEVLQIYKSCISGMGSVEEMRLDGVCRAFEDALQLGGVALPAEGIALIRRFVAGPLAKRFVILTGLSGSGKTQLAQTFFRWICEDKSQAELLAVGADWTNNENLLGYPDALQENSYRKPDNGVLDLILRARKNPDLPHFLILDEMNLSHVERYFADFLSAMESGETISLHDDTGEDWDGVPAKLCVPANLFVIGTVNVDETTYMFSPKVLDRANVIEFRVSEDEMRTFLEKPVKPNLDLIAGKGSQYGKAFAASARQQDVALDAVLRQKVADVLMKFFPELKDAGAEFGYRTAHEICRFVHFHQELSGDEWLFEQAMDAAILQKLLPKLHGSKKKLGPVLDSLVDLCGERFPDSLEKISRMQKRLQEHGFTSFAEA